VSDTEVLGVSSVSAQPLELPSLVRRASVWRRLLRNWSVRLGAGTLALLLLMSVFAPSLGVIDPSDKEASNINRRPGESGTVTLASGETIHRKFWMGTDGYGQDTYSRVLYGGRVSLKVGASVAGLSLLLGLLVGLTSGYVRWIDGILMRVMDALMAIPGVLLALFLVALWRASLWTVIVAITLVEIPRVARLVRAVALSIREEPYVEAAIAAGSSTPQILFRHILPNTIGPIVVQGTYVCAMAMLLESILSFLGVGIPTETPSWGNIMQEGRTSFTEYPHNVLFPAAFLALTVLAVNMLGDGLRDTLDPRFHQRGERQA
jgi:peptide/nickel transport system permease protein